ncbi:MAG TPA: PQQ-binding-like beta-propeller repeat protein, partial [Gemmataceae bacterium]|nr:PQQ-binding-like beta-propeller repeat protein [Gemmataceae bacterium]
HDPLSLRRATAAVALVDGANRPASAIRELLHDSDQEVRLRVAMALVEHKDKTAVPALIERLGDRSVDQLWQAEELLRRLAGSKAPAVSLGNSAADQRRCQEAWAAWWRKEGPRVDMAALNSVPRQLGYTLIVQFLQWGNNSGRVYEIGPDKKVRWHVDGYNMPVDAQLVAHNHVLVADFYQSEVTERDLKGKIVWQHQASNPVSVQRLPNGHTFIAGQNEIKEIEHSGKTVYTFAPPGGACMAARKLRNGQIVAISNTGTLSRVDTTGKLLKSFSVGNVNWGGMDVLSNGHILVAQQNMSKVVEYDPDGKAVWQYSTNWPSSAVRLANGNTLIASQNSQEVFEVTRAGKKVWDYRTDGHPWHARRR